MNKKRAITLHVFSLVVEYPFFSREWLLFWLESEYQSKQTVNETQRDVKVVLLLIDQWLVQELKSLTGLISSNVRRSLNTAPFRENIARGHSYSPQIKLQLKICRAFGEFIWCCHPFKVLLFLAVGGQMLCSKC